MPSQPVKSSKRRPRMRGIWRRSIAPYGTTLRTMVPSWTFSPFARDCASPSRPIGYRHGRNAPRFERFGASSRICFVAIATDGGSSTTRSDSSPRTAPHWVTTVFPMSVRTPSRTRLSPSSAPKRASRKCLRRSSITGTAPNNTTKCWPWPARRSPRRHPQGIRHPRAALRRETLLHPHPDRWAAHLENHRRRRHRQP